MNCYFTVKTTDNFYSAVMLSTGRNRVDLIISAACLCFRSIRVLNLICPGIIIIIIIIIM